MMEKIKAVIILLVSGKWNVVIKEIFRRFYSDETAYLLRRDLDVPIEISKARIQILIRELQLKDLTFLFGESDEKLDEEGLKEKIRRKLLIHSDIQKCYVAVDESGSACYMQWLIGEGENKRLRRLYKGTFL